MAIKTSNSGLTEATQRVYSAVSQLNCIKPLYLCGGTSISLQIHHRLSEDLDFELISTKRERPDLAFNEIISEVCTKFKDTGKEILGDDHFLLMLSGKVKLSFFRPENPVPYINEGYSFNNIKTPSLQDLLGMKIFTTTVRNVYRDYYDIYCLLENGLNFKEGLDYALNFSRHTIHTKSVLINLITPQLFQKESDFNENLKPKYDVTSEEICERIKEEIKKLGERTKAKIKLEYKLK